MEHRCYNAHKYLPQVFIFHFLGGHDYMDAITSRHTNLLKSQSNILCRTDKFAY